jgi:hypothetical protein
MAVIGAAVDIARGIGGPAASSAALPEKFPAAIHHRRRSFEALRANELWQERYRKHGHDLTDWLRAEWEIAEWHQKRLHAKTLRS